LNSLISLMLNHLPAQNVTPGTYQPWSPDEELYRYYGYDKPYSALPAFGAEPNDQYFQELTDCADRSRFGQTRANPYYLGDPGYQEYLAWQARRPG
jgi:hypothetical protein